MAGKAPREEDDAGCETDLNGTVCGSGELSALRYGAAMLVSCSKIKELDVRYVPAVPSFSLCGASLGGRSVGALLKGIGLRFTKPRCNVNGFNKNGS